MGTLVRSALALTITITCSTSPRAAAAQTAPVTLDELLRHADENAPALRTAAARADLVNADAADAERRLREDPSVDIAIGGRTLAGQHAVEFETGVSQSVELGRQRARRMDAVDANRALAAATIDETAWSVHVEVHRLHSATLLAQERLTQAQHFVAFAASLRDIAARKVDAGESPPLVLLVADADLAQARELEVDAQQALTALRTQLATAAGYHVDALPPIGGELPPVIEVPTLRELLERASADHPSIAVRDAALAAAEAQARVAERAGLPDPTLGLSYGREGAPGGGNAAHVWVFALSVPLPVSGSARAAQMRAAAHIDIERAERHALVTTLQANLITAASALAAAAERVALYERDVIPNLEHNLTLLQRAYELGEADVHQVSQTRQRLLEASAHYLDARTAYFDNAAVLESWVGSEFINATNEGHDHAY